LAKRTVDQSGVDVEQLNLPRNQENRKQQIGHGHVYNEKVDAFSHGFRLVDNYSADGVPSQRHDKNQAVSDGLPDFFFCRIPVAARWLCFIHLCI